MALTKSRFSTLDRNRVDLSMPALVRHWRKRFGKTEEEIADAIAKVGEQRRNRTKRTAAQQLKTWATGLPRVHA